MRHLDPVAMNNSRVCRYFGTAEGCKYGDKCRFSHVAEVSGAVQYTSIASELTLFPLIGRFLFPEPFRTELTQDRFLFGGSFVCQCIDECSSCQSEASYQPWRLHVQEADSLSILSSGTL